MLTYSTYSEAGGVGKTTTAANLAVAHARAGLKPLVVPLDPQDGELLDVSHGLHREVNAGSSTSTGSNGVGRRRRKTRLLLRQ